MLVIWHPQDVEGLWRRPAHEERPVVPATHTSNANTRRTLFSWSTELLFAGCVRVCLRVSVHSWLHRAGHWSILWFYETETDTVLSWMINPMSFIVENVESEDI